MYSDGRPLTLTGKLVRRSSLDELPQFWNVLRGDMSIVGPRPLLAEYLPLYSVEQRRRHTVKPGITGLAQINGRNALTWGEKFGYDLHYVDNLSFLLDLRIIGATALKVLSMRKKNGCGVETRSFNGNTIC
ncbi:sugar transferase [Dyadobacter sp. 676]|uniref:Sugar transferase n=1 Tax=Dyadobacter sp. 676 TaxID=3088362 RepID=A0AAU8FUR0_9BACT